MRGRAFPGSCTLTCGSGDKSLRGQSDKLAADEDYTIKLFVNSVARNGPTVSMERDAPCYCLENDNRHIYRLFKLSYLHHAFHHLDYFVFIK